MLEVGPGFIQRALFDLHVRLGLMKGRHCLIDVSLRRSLLRKQFLCPFAVHSRELERGLGVCQISLRLSDGGLKKSRIDLGDHLARFHLRIKIRKQFCDISRNLAAYLHINDWIERACGRDSLGDGAARDHRSLIICRASVATLTENGRDNQQRNNDGKPGDKTFHSSNG